MPYIIAEEPYATKDAIAERCRDILKTTADGSPVDETYAAFLFDLFRYHDEWEQKSLGGVCQISTQTTSQGTRCFVLVIRSGEKVDISFPHAIKLIPSRRSAALLPQRLLDFRNAARTAVRQQIYAFRDRVLQTNPTCPYTGERLTRVNCAVDHTPPATFDRLLFEFCQSRVLNPLGVSIDSLEGTVPMLADQDILVDWTTYHESAAHLRLLSRIGNLQLTKEAVPWSELIA